MVDEPTGSCAPSEPGTPDLSTTPDADDAAWAARRRTRRRRTALAVLLFPLVLGGVAIPLGLLRGGPKHVVDSAELGYRVTFPGTEPTSSWGPPGPLRIHADHGQDPRTGIEYVVSCLLAPGDLDDDPTERFRRAKDVLERKLGPLDERTVGPGARAPHELTSADGRTVVRVVLAGRRTFFLLASGPGVHDSREARAFFESFTTREPALDG